MPEQSAFEIELAIEKLKSHKSPGVDQIPAELIKAVSRTIRYDMIFCMGVKLGCSN